MTLLYTILGIVAWLGCGYFAAWLAFKFDIVSRNKVNDNLGILVLSGVITLFMLIVVVLGVELIEKLKFKEKEEK